MSIPSTLLESEIEITYNMPIGIIFNENQIILLVKTIPTRNPSSVDNPIKMMVTGIACKNPDITVTIIPGSQMF